MTFKSNLKALVLEKDNPDSNCQSVSKKLTLLKSTSMGDES